MILIWNWHNWNIDISLLVADLWFVSELMFSIFSNSVSFNVVRCFDIQSNMGLSRFDHHFEYEFSLLIFSSHWIKILNHTVDSVESFIILLSFKNINSVYFLFFRSIFKIFPGMFDPFSNADYYHYLNDLIFQTILWILSLVSFGF